MKFSRRVIILLVLVLASVLDLSSRASAQLRQMAEMLIMYTDTIEFADVDGLTLRVFFTPVDGSRKPVLNPPIRSGELVLDIDDDDPLNGGKYKVSKLEQAKGPILITLVLDTSGSMGRRVDQLRQSAIDLVKGTPQEFFYSIVSFSSTVVPPTVFTNDKAALEAAIRRVPNAAGNTCLYDATFRALESTISNQPKGRRAVVVFTDGVDETDKQGQACSQKTLQDVLDLSSGRLEFAGSRLRVPIYALGFKQQANSRIDTQGLQRMAQESSGLFAEANDIRALFTELVDAFNAQLVAEAVIRPREGKQIPLSLALVTQDGKQFRESTFFDSPKDFRRPLPQTDTPTPTATITSTATAIPSFDTSPAATFNGEAKQFEFTISGIVSGSAIKEFRIVLIGADNLVKREKVIPNPPPDKVTMEIPPDLPASDRLLIRIRAMDTTGRVITERDIPASFLPTPTITPTPTLTPTATPETSVLIREVQYTNPTEKREVRLNLILNSPEKIAAIAFQLVDTATNLSPRQYGNFPVAPEIVVNLDGVPAGKYRLIAIPLGPTGQPVGQAGAFEFVHQPPITPSPTPSLTPTPVVITALINNIKFDIPNDKFLITVEAKNRDKIKTYEFDFRNEQGESVRTRRMTQFTEGPDFIEVQIPIEGLPTGKYLIVLRALNENNEYITDRSGIEIAWVAPATPTPTPSATPEPNDIIYLISKALKNPQQAPIVIGVMVALFGGLLLVAFIALRPRKKAKTGTDFLASMTGAIDVSKMKEMQQQDAKRGSRAVKPAPSAPSAPPAQGRGVPPPAPMAPSGMDDRTSAVPFASMPTAGIYVENSRDPVNVGKTVPLSQFPFTLGRKNRDLNFDNDDNVSRGHAEIVFENGIYYLQDNNSTHGTFVDERQVPAGTRAPLYNGAMIRLGTTTVLRFVLQDGGGAPGVGGDPDRTSPEMPQFRR